jgi:hypothetical protein
MREQAPLIAAVAYALLVCAYAWLRLLLADPTHRRRR